MMLEILPRLFQKVKVSGSPEFSGLMNFSFTVTNNYVIDRGTAVVNSLSYVNLPVSRVRGITRVCIRGSLVQSMYSV